MGMIDISDKRTVERMARAEGTLNLRKETIECIKEGTIKKGDPFKTAEASALQSIKTTFMQIPHCHPIPITSAGVEFKIEGTRVICNCTVKANYKTGVEMETLCGVTTALLTVWDMVKYLEKDENGQYPTAEINGIKVVEKIKTD